MWLISDQDPIAWPALTCHREDGIRALRFPFNVQELDTSNAGGQQRTQDDAVLPQVDGADDAVVC